MAIADLFRPKAPVAPAASADQNAGQQQQQNQNQNPPQSEQGQQEANPLDQFSDLWAPPKKGEGQKEETKKSVDPTALSKAVQGMDFTKNISPEILSQISAGGDGATQATMKLVNNASQQALEQALVVASKLMESKMAQMREEFAQTADQRFKTNSVEGALFGGNENSVLTNPATKPLVQATARQIAERNPNFTPEQVKAATLAMFNSLAEGLVGGKKEQKQEAPASADWDSWLNS